MALEVVVDIPPPPGVTLPIASEKQVFPCVRAQLHSKCQQRTAFITSVRKMDSETLAHIMEGFTAAAVLAKGIENEFQQDKHLDAVVCNTKGFVGILKDMLSAVEKLECVGKFERVSQVPV